MRNFLFAIILMALLGACSNPALPGDPMATPTTATNNVVAPTPKPPAIVQPSFACPGGIVNYKDRNIGYKSMNRGEVDEVKLPGGYVAKVKCVATTDHMLEVELVEPTSTPTPVITDTLTATATPTAAKPCGVINDYQLKDLPEIAVEPKGWLHVQWWVPGNQKLVPEHESVFPSGRYLVAENLVGTLSGHVWEYSPACTVDEVIAQVKGSIERRLQLKVNTVGYVHYQDLLTAGIFSTVVMTGDPNVPETVPGLTALATATPQAPAAPAPKSTPVSGNVQGCPEAKFTRHTMADSFSLKGPAIAQPWRDGQPQFRVMLKAGESAEFVNIKGDVYVYEDNPACNANLETEFAKGASYQPKTIAELKAMGWVK